MASRLTRLAPLTRLTRPLAFTQHNASSSIRHASNSSSEPFQSAPSPPRLPADQQAEFERLQRTANTQAGFNPTSTPDFTSPVSSSSSADSTAATPAIEEGGEFAPVPLRKGAPPEFEGDVNPKTGEVGGPKNEPLRWGAAGDYSFNGRVTDF
ncbi:DUF1674-domain-containing protein [Hypoxylon rubiginosum]|uniref:DUF1674-domain-containing protein n=1 Tax=Hypoxylon rubiginosum TaxID=110542 RepID=A0ACB9Z8X2_9PEZI|nr:DUF1674-domain-containing protein [Hypoxylon rubiginosum]